MYEFRLSFMADPGGKWTTVIIAITGIVLSSGLFGPTVVNLVTKPWVNLVMKPNYNKASFQMQNVDATAATHVYNQHADTHC